MNSDLRKNKAIIRDFLQKQYSDTNLAEILDALRSGVFAYASCCCFIGIPTAPHAIRGWSETVDIGTVMNEPHYIEARKLPSAWSAEAAAFCLVAGYRSFWDRSSNGESGEANYRRLLLTPIVKAEIRRRMRPTPINDAAKAKEFGITREVVK